MSADISEVTAAIAADAAEDTPHEMGAAEVAALVQSGSVNAPSEPLPEMPPEVPGGPPVDTKEAQWPQVEAVHGRIYSFTDPSWGQRLVGMTIETFLSIREDINKMKAALTSAQFDNIKLYQELQTRPPAPPVETKSEPRILTPATGMRLPNRN